MAGRELSRRRHDELRSNGPQGKMKETRAVDTIRIGDPRGGKRAREECNLVSDLTRAIATAAQGTVRHCAAAVGQNARPAARQPGPAMVGESLPSVRGDLTPITVQRCLAHCAAMILRSPRQDPSQYRSWFPVSALAISSRRRLTAGLPLKRCRVACKTVLPRRLKLREENLRQQQQGSLRTVLYGHMRFEKRPADLPFEELRKPAQHDTRTQRHTEMTRAPVAQDASTFITQAPESFGLRGQSPPLGAEMNAAAPSRSRQALVSALGTKPRRVCFEAVWEREGKPGSEIHVGPTGAAVTSGAGASPALSVSAVAFRCPPWWHSKKSTILLARDNTPLARAHEAQQQQSAHPAQDDTRTRPWYRTVLRNCSHAARQNAYRCAPVSLRRQLYACRLRILWVPKSGRPPLTLGDRLVSDGFRSRWYRRAHSAMAETTWRAGRSAQLRACNRPSRTPVRAGIPEPSGRAGRPLHNRSIPPAPGGALCARSTPGSGARARSIQEHFANNLPSTRAADGYRP
jgi:hypothetical protein